MDPMRQITTDLGREMPYDSDVPEGIGPLTEEDYWNFPEDGLHRQLIDGWEVIMPPVRLSHQRPVQYLIFHLMDYLRDHPLGEVTSGPYPVRLSSKSVVEPDVFVILEERFGIMEDLACQDAPDLAVEVLSPSNRRVDEIRKLRLYERHGVREYWIVDPRTQAIRIYRRQGERLLIQAELLVDREDCLTTPLLPGFELPLEKVFPRPPREDDERGT